MENSGFEKARILLDCLLPVCQSLKIGIKRHPLFANNRIMITGQCYKNDICLQHWLRFFCYLFVFKCYMFAYDIFFYFVFFHEHMLSFSQAFYLANSKVCPLIIALFVISVRGVHIFYICKVICGQNLFYLLLNPSFPTTKR